MHSVKIVVAALAVAALFPAAASADAPICHNGILSDDAGQGCADGLYAQVYGSGGSGSSSSSDICHDGILSDDAGQGCADGMYERVYGSGSAPTTSATSAAPTVHIATPSVSSSTGSSNSMVNPACESGGNPQVVDSTGTYWGKYQFDRQTWAAFGGSSSSYGSASEAEQDAVAARVNYDAWPNC